MSAHTFLGIEYRLFVGSMGGYMDSISRVSTYEGNSGPCNRNVLTSNTTSRDIDQSSLLDCTTTMNNHFLSM